ncbi:MAG: GNAT family N-acetyltransferase [Acidobacteriota bacterium]|nr:GNAT family N-acetyltransferase [Acidobacteriota bacterium]
MKIRTIQREDFNDWSRLRKELWAHVAEDENLIELEQVLADGGKSQIFLAENGDGEIIGFLEASLRYEYVEGCDYTPVGYIEGWFVEENYRRKQVGRELVEAAENWARVCGCLEMASDCELENSVSRAAHFGVGYEEAARIIHFKKFL